MCERFWTQPDHNPLARKVVRERVALSALARKSDNRRRFGDCLLRRQFVFRRVRFQFFEVSASWSISRAERSDFWP
jgi:hypothetical protein